MKLSLIGFITIVAAAGSLGCSKTRTASLCNEGDEFVHVGETYCLYSEAISEQGFMCPPEAQFEHRFSDFAACAFSAKELPDDFEAEARRFLDRGGAKVDAGIDATVAGPGGELGICCPVYGFSEGCSHSGVAYGGWAPSLEECPEEQSGFDYELFMTTDEWGCEVIQEGGDCLIPPELEEVLIGQLVIEQFEATGPTPRALQLAVDEVNASGGLLDGLEVKIASATEAEDDFDGFQSLVDQGVVGVVGPTNPQSVFQVDAALAGSLTPIPYFSTFGGGFAWLSAVKRGESVWGRSGFGIANLTTGIPAIEVAAQAGQCSSVGYVGVSTLSADAATHILSTLEAATLAAQMEWKSGAFDDFIPDSLTEECEVLAADPPECVVVDSPFAAYFVRDCMGAGGPLPDARPVLAGALIPPLTMGISELSPLIGAVGARLLTLSEARTKDLMERYEAVHGEPLDAGTHSYMATNYDHGALLMLAIEKAGNTKAADILQALQEISDANNAEQYGPTELATALGAIRAGRDVAYLGATTTTDYSAGGPFSEPPPWECYVIDDGEGFSDVPCP